MTMNLTHNAKKKIVVTGCAGFIGSHLVEELIKNGHEVIGLDDLSAGSMANLSFIKDGKNFKFFEGKIQNIDLVSKIVENAYAVFHLAALVSVPLCTLNPDQAVENNIDGFTKVLNASAKAKVKKFFYASSCAVYGDQGEQAICEEAPLCPISMYALTKESNEKIAHFISKEFSINTYGLRFFNVYGPRQDPKGPYAGVIAKFIDLALSHSRPTIWGSGDQTRDFIYVKDLVSACLQLLTLSDEDSKKYSILNIASGKSRSVIELWDILLKITDAKTGNNKENNWMKPNFQSRRMNDILHSKSSIEKLNSLFNLSNQNYQPLSLEEGISNLLSSLQKE